MAQFTIGPIAGQQVSATDQVFYTLYDAVIAAKLPPGAKVSESDIAKQLGVSRQPVRDAFFRLSNLGFLSIRPQRATLITQISRRAVIDAIFTRTALEVECLKSAMTKQHDMLVTTLRDHLTAQRNAVDNGASAFYPLDESFHESICRLAGHTHVWSLIQAQKAHLDRIRVLTLTEEQRLVVVADHQKILDAVEAGDVVAAEIELRDHIAGVLVALETLETLYPDYFDPTDTLPSQR